MKRIKLPVSKSIFIRKLIADFLYKMYWDSVPDDAPTDVQVTYDCLVRIANNKDSSIPVEINVNDCGAAYRFLMAVLAVTPGSWFLTGEQRLLQRPISDLADALISIGAEIKNCENGWKIYGKELYAEEITIDCSVSSQFASALLLIGYKIGLISLNILPENPRSASYIDMTASVLQNYQQISILKIADWSAALYWYAKISIEGRGSYLLEGLTLNSIQPDAIIAKWFASWGVKSKQLPDGVLISVDAAFQSENQLVTLDVSQNIDTVPVLACMACMQQNTFVFNGVSNLRLKESNRLEMIRNNLSRFADVMLESFENEEDNRMIIMPKSIPSYEDMLVFDACNDHRFVMGFTLFALKSKVTIKGVESVRKSYPNFETEAVNAGVDIVR